MNFKVGEKVVALTDPMDGCCQYRKAGNIYTVLDVMYCSRCGLEHIYIGGTTRLRTTDRTVCACGNYMPALGKSWTESRQFTRPISNEYKLEVSIPELLTIKQPQFQ